MRVAALKAGIDGYIMGFEDLATDSVATRLEHIKTSSASKIVVALFLQFCDFEIASDQVSEDYRQAMVELRTDFTNLLKRHNLRINPPRHD